MLGILCIYKYCILGRKNDIKFLKNRHEEALSQQHALNQQIYQLSERHKKLQTDLLLLKEEEKQIDNQVFNLWQVPSWFIITDFNTDSTTDFNESA